MNNIAKSYKLDFSQNEIHLTRNREFKNEKALIFPANKKGIVKMTDFLSIDIDRWSKK